jgi:hypothetical protein
MRQHEQEEAEESGFLVGPIIGDENCLEAQ